MGEYAASYKEGFTCDADTPLATTFDILTTAIPSISYKKPDGKTTDPVPFLDAAITQQQETLESLQKIASKLAPVAQKMATVQTASDAAFESDVHPGLPSIGGTLQGFVLLFFCVSFVILAIMSTFMVNAISGGGAAAATFGGFLAAGIIVFAVIQRYA